jgi:hypothetical protein
MVLAAMYSIVATDRNAAIVINGLELEKRGVDISC